MFNNKDIEQAAQRHAREEYPRESVGMVQMGQYVPLENTHETPCVSFSASFDSDVAEAIIHSHPNQSVGPSIRDMQQQQAFGVPWGIISATEHECSPISWFGDGTPILPYLGRPFLDGVTDCWTLVRDWYSQERHVVLDNLPREENWHLPLPRGAGLDLLNTLTIQQCGFYQIDKSELRLGDVILGQIASPVVNHCGLYLGNGLVMHHMGGRLSCREPLGRHINYCRYFVRHEACR